MGLIDKFIDSIRRGRKDAIIRKLRKDPEFAKAMDKHQRSYEEFRDAILKKQKESITRKKG